jgi:predicted nucleic acid-binding protein
VIVVDASAMLELLLNAPSAQAVGDRILTPGQTIQAPHLMDIEVLQVLRRYVRTNVISPGRAQEALEDYTDLPITRYPHNVLLTRIWELRHNLTAYDAAYVALAEALDAPLVTCDRRLAASAGHRAKILVF